MPQPPRSLRAIPLARGLVRLAASLSPLFRRTGVARGRERLFLWRRSLAPLALVFAPDWLGLGVGGITTVALLGWLLRGRTLYLHGAEHARSLPPRSAGSSTRGTASRGRRASRFAAGRTSPRC